MPIYCYCCESCGRRWEHYRPTRQASVRPQCQCGRRGQRDYSAERPAVQRVFEPYVALSGGVPEHVMETARKVGDNWYDHQGRQLNPTGYDLDKKTGGLVIRSAEQRKQYMRDNNLVDLNDFHDVRAERERRQKPLKKAIERAKRRNAAYQRAARKRLGWSKS